MQLFKAIFCFECALLEESESGHWILQHLPTIRLSVRASCIFVTICSRYQETIITVYYMNESDLRSDVHYLGSSENKA